MKKINIQIKGPSLFFKYRVKKLDEPNLLNTNIISNNELVFSDEYIANNQKIVSSFIRELIKDEGITNIVVTNMDIADIAIDLVKNVDNIEIFKIDSDEAVSYSFCEKVIAAKNIKVLNCYSVPQFMIEMLDQHDIKVESRYEVLFSSNFMAQNNLTSFSKMYYSTNVTINNILTDNDVEDFKAFCSINKYLKNVHFDRYSLDSIKRIADILLDSKKKRITLNVHEDIEDLDEISKLKAYNKYLKKNTKLKVELSYSDDYINSNYTSQIAFTTLKTCAFLIIGIVGAILAFLVYNNYESEKKVNKITQELTEILQAEEAKKEVTIEYTEEGEPIPTPIQPTIVEKNGKPIINSYNKLLELNPDSVGWLKVKGTKIDYPVLQAKDNSFYLDHNFYKDRDYNGWVFMDYRNSIDNLDDNTIIYAHNRYTSGVMFGTLQKVSEESIYSREANLYITFNSLYKNMTWKIFSFYSIDVTSDYLVTLFLDNEMDDKQAFIDMLVNRSEVKLDTYVSVKDKILTLSTCLDNNRRFVVHAVLVS
jgi:sortase B